MTEYFSSLTHKGQTTIPVTIRRALKLKQGDKIGFVLEAGQVRLTRADSVVARTAGVLRTNRPAMCAGDLRQQAEEAIAADRGAPGEAEMTAPFLDTNVLLRHLLGDDLVQSPAATRILERVERGELRVRISDLVIMECVFTLQRTYRQPRAAIGEALLPLIELPGVILPGKRHFRRIFELYASLNLPFADAYHAVLMKRLRLSEIISFDADFDRVEGIRRVEPGRA